MLRKDPNASTQTVLRPSDDNYDADSNDDDDSNEDRVGAGLWSSLAGQRSKYTD